MDKTAPCEQSRHCTASAPRAPAAPRFAPDADQLARLLTPALFDRVRDAIIVLGIDHRIWVWNKSAELMYGWSAGEVLGRPIPTLLPADSTVFADACKAVYTHGEWNGEITGMKSNAELTRYALEHGLLV